MPNLEIDANDVIETLTNQRNEALHNLALTDAALKGNLRKVADLEATVEKQAAEIDALKQKQTAAEAS